MKKAILSLLVLLVVFLTLTACSEPACKHDDPTQIVVVDAKEPTCQKTGLTEGLRCNLCGTMVVPQANIPVTKCNENLEILPSKEPTCQENGLEAGKQCKICKTIVVEQKVIPKLDCIESSWIIDKKATKTEEGIMHTECVMCGTIFTRHIIYAGSQGLIYSVTAIDGSCGVDGMGTCNDYELVIPQYWYDKPVTFISWGAFDNCQLTSVIIPCTVTDIYMEAFKGCRRLETIVFNGTIEQWIAIDKGNGWDENTGDYIIYCTDGEITKDGTVTLY